MFDASKSLMMPSSAEGKQMSEMGDIKFTTAGDMMKDQEIARLRAAVQDLAKHVWRGDWDKLHPDTRALVEEKE